MIEIPPNEMRKFKYGILPNKLKYVVIQDKDEECAQVSLVVKAGSMDEDVKYMGLAHFLEHMLFLGSKKHMKESYFEEMINEMGGSTNAFTGGFETCYYMNMLSKHLDKILSIYSRFFIDPLFDSNSITREINAINSEHLKNINNEYWFVKQIIHNISLKESGINRFSTGTLETLKSHDISELRKAMIDFYNTYYISNNMCICIQSNEDVNIVEQYIVKYFTEIKESNKSIINAENNILKTKFNIKSQDNYEYQIFPVSESNYILYMWDIMTKTQYMYNSAIDCISNTILFNGVNNIKNILKQNGLANGIETIYLEEGIYILKINMNKVDDIVELKKQIKTINHIIKKYLDTIITWDWDNIYKYQLKKDRITYNYGSKINNMDLVNMIAMNLHYFEEKNVYNGEMLAVKPNINSVKELLKKLTFNNSTIFYCMKEKIGDIPDMKEDVFYMKKYGILNDTFIHNMDQININFSIKLAMNTLDIKPVVIDNLNTFEVPTMIDSSNMVWYGASSRFNDMIVCGSINISHKNIFSTVANYMLTSIAINTINHYISLYFSQDFELGYSASYSTNITSGVIKLSINGYNYNYKKFVYRVIEYVKTIKPEDIIINIIIDRIIENLKNINTLTALEYATYILALQQYKYMYNHIDKLKYISILLNDNYIEKIISRINSIVSMDKLSIFTIFYGNISMHDIPIIKSNYKTPTIPKPNIPTSISLKHPNEIEKNKAIIMLLPCGIFFPPIISQLLLLDMLMSQPAYQQLRTKEQLGYIVNCSMMCDNTNYYMKIKVQSKFDNSIVEEKINNFLEYFKKYLDELDVTIFNNMKKSLYTTLLKKSNNINELMDKYIDEIENRTFIFYRNELLASYVKDIELNNIIILYNNIIKTKIVIKIN